MTLIKKVNRIESNSSFALVGTDKTNWSKWELSDEENTYVKQQLEDGKKFVAINRLSSWVFVLAPSAKKDESTNLMEHCRITGAKLCQAINQNKIKEITIVDTENKKDKVLAVAEGAALANYQFLKYRKNADKEKNSLESILLRSSKSTPKDVDYLNIQLEAVYAARTLVNEPVSYLTAERLAKELTAMAKDSGSKVEVFNKKKIEALRMGGLLAVNKGSQDPPTFTILEHKPARPVNKKPYVLVGKGVVYDTGGLSLKPTKNSMDKMKSDMAGAAAVACAHHAVAKANLPVHLITLIPATDNRPGEKAYTPGDVVTMYNGLTVEVLNTDAEGRMILADALSYASKYDPKLVMDFATLTGAALAAVGEYASVIVGTADEGTKKKLKASGYNTFERLAEFPFWDEYGEMVKSKIAEIKNVGGAYGGAITAGKFLQNFTDYPWMHFDIAGPAFIAANSHYRTQGGTGVGVRLLFDFFRNIAKK